MSKFKDEKNISQGWHDYRSVPHLLCPSALKYATRSTFLVAALVVVASMLIALLLQLGLLGALKGAGSTNDIALAPVANVQAVKSADKSADNGGLLYDTSRGPAVAQARSIQLAANDVLAVTLRTSDVTGEVRGIFGWLSTRDLRRSASTPIPVAAGAEPRTTTLLLSGHPRWRDTLPQIGLGFEGRFGQPGGVLVREFELVPANLSGGAELLASAWFGRNVSIIKPPESASRLLPLALWFVVVCALSVAALVVIYRRSPARRAASLQAVVALLAVLAVALTLLNNQWPGGSAAALAAIAAMAMLWLIEPLPQVALSQTRRWLLAGAMAVVCVVASPWVAPVAAVPAPILLINQWRPGAWGRWAALALAAPALAVCAIAQKLVTGPALFATLADPTAALASVATSSAGLPGFAAGLLAAHHFWPAPAQTRRWSVAAGAAAGWALTGAMLVVTVPAIASRVSDQTTMVCLFLPFLACLLLAVRPKFTEVAASFTDTEVVPAKSEEDISAQALALLESHAERVRNMLAQGKTGAARAAVTQMQMIAAQARMTGLADLRVSLANGDLIAAEKAAAVLRSKDALTATEADALLELAHRQDQQQQVIELAPLASRNEGNTRALALAQLRTSGPSAALTVLSQWPDETTFAREIADLHLLGDDLANAQQAMVNTGISLGDPIGQAYVARMGLRAQGPVAQAEGIAQLALWHPQVGAAQAAQGELLMRQGNLAGARARFLLAMKLDPLLWPLQKHLQVIDAQVPAETTV